MNFTNSFIKSLPQDPETKNQIRQVRNACWSLVYPQKFENAKIVSINHDFLTSTLEYEYTDKNKDEFLKFFSGDPDYLISLKDQVQPYSTCYAGHQFGNFAGQLGDGRAINLGEIETSQGLKFELQLKGSGVTPYSRGADGYAVMRSSIREYLCAEAMHHLNIPTTRSLCLIDTGSQVLRDMFYNGHPKMEPGAVVCRVASSFIRFGHFEMMAYFNETDLLLKFVTYTIDKEYQHLNNIVSLEERVLAFLKEVRFKTNKMVVGWMGVGFVHGVMNTDNLSISGLTIDYGPYGWLDVYDPDFTPNTTDFERLRYGYKSQPAICIWNFSRLCMSVSKLFPDNDNFINQLKQLIEQMNDEYELEYYSLMHKKLHLFDFDSNKNENEFKNLVKELLELLDLCKVDWTIFFRLLSNININEDISEDESEDDKDLDKGVEGEEKVEVNYLKIVEYSFYDKENANLFQLEKWLIKYVELAKTENKKKIEEKKENEGERTSYIKNNNQRKEEMDKVNPKYILRNFIAYEAIRKYEEEADGGETVNKILEVLKNPFTDQGKEVDDWFFVKRPNWADNKKGCSTLSCSS